MKLTIATPLQVVVDTEAISIRAEDETGSFGIAPGHAALLTVLVPSVVSWRGPDGASGHAAVRGGVLVVRDDRIELATREAVPGADLGALEEEVIRRFRADEEEEQRARHGTARLEVEVIRRITQSLRGARQPVPRAGEKP